MKQKPKIFLSYSSFDERHDRGRISAFCERLRDEVRIKTAEEPSIWFDRDAFKAADDWRVKIAEKLQEANIMIAFITPSYLESSYCRREFTQFLDKEKDQKSLIVPIIYIGDEANLAADDLGKETIKHKHFDWRDLRFESFTSTRLKREIEKAADAIGNALENVSATSSDWSGDAKRS